MKIAAIVAEYNPFHNGHKYQIDKAREILGEDTAIVVVMSGNYTQRGELAICDKLIRAKSAVNCGVDLVLELPHPYSMSSAEFFAKSAIHIIEKIGVADYLVFGTEDSAIEEIKDYVDLTESDEFKALYQRLSSDKEFADLGYPKLCEITASKLNPAINAKKFSSPNNILAVEYIRALKKECSHIIPLPITRKGAGYNDNLIEGTMFQSASAIRSLITDGDISALKYIPEGARNIYSSALSSKKMPSSEDRLSTALITNLRLNPPSFSGEIHDASGGLYNRLYKLSFKANSIQSLTSAAETKKYTKARIRRAIWNTFFGVTSSEVRTLPAFTQILAMNSVGRQVLKRIPKTADFHVFTKPSRSSSLPEHIIEAKARADRADSVYGLSLEDPNNGSFYLTMTPYVKE